MPLTITKRITIGVAMMFFFSGALSLLLYLDLKKIMSTLEHVLHVEEPTSAAAHEMEINMLEIGMRVMKYNAALPTDERLLLDKDIADFDNFHAKYTRLANTPKARELGINVKTMYQSFKALGFTIMNGRDTISHNKQVFERNLKEIETLINFGLMQSIAPRDSKGLEKLLSAQVAAPKSSEKLLVIQAMKSGLAEIGDALGDYLETFDISYKRRIANAVTEFKSALARFNRLPGSHAQAPISAKIKRRFEQLHVQANRNIAFKEKLHQEEQRFIELRQKIDDELDEGVQALTTAQLETARNAVAQVTQDVLAALLILAPLLIVGSVTGAVIMVRWIKRPIEELTEGAHRIGSGDWEHRIPQRGRDEFANLAVQFNQMVERLQSTTVSKLQLEASEKELQNSNVQLIKEIEEHKMAQATIQQMAYYDSLTDLPNRRLFHDRLQQTMLTATRDNKPVAVMLMDLDHFKEVNDTLGHHYGDILLQQVGERVRSLLRESDTIARLGGDEFAVLLGNTDKQGATLTAENINEALNQPFDLGDINYNARMSIGISLFPQHGNDTSTLLRCADIAMYVAKGEGSGHTVYSVEQDHHSTERLLLMGELRRALDNNQELVLYYQPIIDCTTKQVVSLEALVRWRHPKRGLLLPDEFIGRAERSGLIAPLTLWVLDEALRQGDAWQAAGIARLPIAINLSAASLHFKPLWARVGEILQHHDLISERLALEITESAIMEDPAYARSLLTYLHELGISLSIDDFGTGYSSLAYLSRLPMRCLKIDKSFVIGMLENENDEMIVRSTIDLSHNLKIKVVAEGVENQQILDSLIAHGCDLAQGYFIGKPLPANEFIAWLSTSQWTSKQEQEQIT